MKIKYLGPVVRERRKQLGLRQDMVCEGLCTTMTLSRFENGRQTPSWDCVVAIFQRLGLQYDRFFAQLTMEETQLARLKKEVRACCDQFEKAPEKERRQARINALQKLLDLEYYVKKDDRINRQFILRMKVTLEPHTPQEQLEMLMQAIRLTSPRFDPDEIANCLYCIDELVIINKIATRYYQCGQHGKAFDIYRQLLKLVQKRFPKHDCLILISYNFALCLASENQWKEALAISELGRQACIKQGNYCILPGFLHIEAGCHYHMGNNRKSMELYQSAYHIYGAIMDTGNQEIVRTCADERFNLAWESRPEVPATPATDPDFQARPDQYRQI